MAKERDDTEVLKAIIAKSTNQTAVAVAQTELSSLQQRKAAVSAAIKPVLDVPQIIAQPTNATAAEAIAGQPRKRGSVQADDDVIKNIRKMREDIGKLSKDAAESKKLLDSILKTNQKYYESNNELINRLLISNGLLAEKIAGASAAAKAGMGQGSVGDGTVTPQPGADGGSGLLGGLGLGAAGYGLWRGVKAATNFVTKPFRKAPTVDIPKAAANSPELAKNKKVLGVLKKGGKAGAILAAMLAAGAPILWAAAYIDADDETKASMITGFFGYVPDWLEDLVTDSPDLAIMLGVQLPELAYNAYTTVKPLVTGGIQGGRAAAAAIAQTKPRIFPKGASGVELKGVNEAAKGIWSQAVQNKTTVNSIANTAVDATDELRSTSKIKTGLMKAKNATKITKDVIQGALAKKLKEDTARIAGKKVPLLSIGIGSAMAGMRAYGGDYWGATEELASGIASLIPVVGTAVSLGLDADLLANDVYENVYGIRPDQEKDPILKEKRWTEIRTMAYDVIKEQYDAVSAKLKEAGNSLYDMFPTLSSEGDDTTSFNAMGDFGPIGMETDPIVVPTPKPEMTPDEAQRTLMGSTNGPRTREGIGLKLPLPKQKMTQEQISNIGNPTGTGPNNVVINKQGDTINNVTNNTNAGGGAAGVAGSPSRVPSPFDYLLYGDTFNWGF